MDRSNMIPVDHFRTQWLPRWSVLSRLGKNPVIRSAYIWFVIVPIAASVATWKFPFGGSVYVLDWKLPFSWEIFYFSSVAFAISTAAYQFFCPALIQDYRTFSEFSRDGKGDHQLAEYMLHAISGDSHKALPREQIALLRGFIEYAENTREIWGLISDESDAATVHRALRHVRIADDDLSDTFWYVLEISDVSRSWMRALCTFFYAVGFGLTLVLAIQDFVAVVRSTL